MFWKVDKHKRNDQSGIIHSFGKSTKKTEQTQEERPVEEKYILLECL